MKIIGKKILPIVAKTAKFVALHGVVQCVSLVFSNINNKIILFFFTLLFNSFLVG